jgi:aspartyl/asparaginyl beta-hydroxylase (cupin superfamily)
MSLANLAGFFMLTARQNQTKRRRDCMAKSNREAVDLMYKINIDADDAIKALKAIQREAREATKSLRELEAEAKKSPYSLTELIDKERRKAQK